MTKMERWLAYFANQLSDDEKGELIMSDEAIHKAVDAARTFLQNDAERLAYINRELAILDYNSDHRDAFEEGKAEGRAEGRKEGEAKGRREGETKGREEGRKEGKLELALELLKDGMSLEKVAKYSKLSLSMIKELAKQNKLI